jgi:hypothetical protein
MTTEDLFINNCSHWEAVKTISECFPELDIIPPLTCKQLLIMYIFYTGKLLLSMVMKAKGKKPQAKTSNFTFHTVCLS